MGGGKRGEYKSLAVGNKKTYLSGKYTQGDISKASHSVFYGK